MRICMQNFNHRPHQIDYRDTPCDGINEVGFIYVVHYPVYEDGVIQYADVAFKNELTASDFATENQATVKKVIVHG